MAVVSTFLGLTLSLSIYFSFAKADIATSSIVLSLLIGEKRAKVKPRKITVKLTRIAKRQPTSLTHQSNEKWQCEWAR